MKAWMKNGAAASAIGLLVVIALIWFIGPLLGLTGTTARVASIMVAILVWGAALLFHRRAANHAGGLIEKLLQRQADDAVIGATADRRAEVNQLRQQLLGAIDTLKSSKIGKARGSAALYELPWYMIIGHPAAGKSSAVLQSGLTFPFSDKTGVRGIGGTRNCDWFFATEGVLLDTAGRYATHTEDRAEWIGFLKLLKRYRSKAPVNGILVAISFPELAQHRSESFSIYARQIRERIHEVEDVFGLQVPVYLVVTKIDLLGGFAQFFEDAEGDERDRVWGATLTHDQGAGFDIRRVVDQQFELLFRGIQQIGEDKLGIARGLGAKPALFAFPLEFHGLKDGISRFAELLHEHDPYHAKPLIRGFYFTSALQEGEPRIAAATRVSQQFALARSGFDARQIPASHSFFLCGLFREVLFPDQYLITRQTKPSGSRLRLAGMLAGLGVLAVLSGLFTWSYLGNQKMVAATRGTREEAVRLLAAPSLYDRLTGLNLLQRRIEMLERYRVDGPPWQIGMALYRGNQLEAVLRRQYFEGVRTIMLEPVKADIEHTLTRLADAAAPAPAAPVAARPPLVAARLDRRPAGLPVIPLRGGASAAARIAPPPAPEPIARHAPAIDGTSVKVEALPLEDGYNALKTYLMLQERPRLDAAHLSDQLPRYWHSHLDENRASHGIEDINALAEPLIAFYLSHLDAPDLPLISNDAVLIESARTTLRSSLTRLSAKERVYNELKAQANTRFAPLSVARILDGKDSTVVGGSAMVPGAFTRAAWEKYVRAAIVQASRGEIKSDDWVLAASTSDDLGAERDADENRKALEALYRADYADAWTKFLQGVAIARPADIASAEQIMGRLADSSTSPIKLLLQRAAYETAWDNPSNLRTTVESARQSVLEKTAQLLDGDSQAPVGSGSSQYGPLGARFVALAAIAGNNDAAGPLMTGYLGQLNKLQGRLAQLAGNDDRAIAARQLMQATLSGSGSEFADAAQYVDTAMLGGVDQASKDMLRPILVRPLLQTYAVLLPPVEADLNQAWQREVYDQWRGLAAKYPFSDSQNEAPLADIARFIKPGEGSFDRFVDKYLSGLVVKRGSQLVPRTWGNQGLHLDQAFLAGAERLSSVATSLMQDGSEVSRFELQPVPTPGLSETMVEIDGQVLRYRNGPQPWQSFAWPAEGGQGARIQVVAFNGATTVVASQPGRMALMRLLGEGRVVSRDANGAQLQWRYRDADQASGVHFNFRMISGANPLQLAGLRGISLPARIAE